MHLLLHVVCTHSMHIATARAGAAGTVACHAAAATARGSASVSASAGARASGRVAAAQRGCDWSAAQHTALCRRRHAAARGGCRCPRPRCSSTGAEGVCCQHVGRGISSNGGGSSASVQQVAAQAAAAAGGPGVAASTAATCQSSTNTNMEDRLQQAKTQAERLIPQYMQHLSSAALAHQRLIVLTKSALCGWSSFSTQFGDTALVGAVAEGLSVVLSTAAGAGEVVSTGLDAGLGACHVFGSNTSKTANRKVHSNGAVGHHDNALGFRSSSLGCGSDNHSSNKLLYPLASSSLTIVGSSTSLRFPEDVLQRALNRGLLLATDRRTCKLMLCLVAVLESLEDLPQDQADADALFKPPADAAQHQPAAGRLLFKHLRFHTGRGLAMVLGVLCAGRQALSHAGLGSALQVGATCCCAS